MQHVHDAGFAVRLYEDYIMRELKNYPPQVLVLHDDMYSNSMLISTIRCPDNHILKEDS